MSERGPAHNAPDEPSSVVSGEQATVAAATPAPGGARAPNRAVADDWTGREVAGRYTIVGRIGEGGMGMVYEAEHLLLKKRVAFKVIHPQLASHPELLERFKREALATGQLDHPHIASAIDFGELETGGAFMVMPLVRGQSLQNELDLKGKMPVRKAAQLGAQIADALGAAHAVGIVHRDLKPDNVLLEQRSDGSAWAKVLDFGVASLAGQGVAAASLAARPLTQAGTILGTPGYMSPEQASAGEIDHRTDLYALGVILWELSRGERLFDGDDITAIFAKQFNQVPPALELGASQAARQFSQLVGRLLSWDKAQRPSTADEVREALRRIAELPDATHPTLEVVPPQVRKHLPYVVAAASLLVAILSITFSGDSPAPTDVVNEPLPANTAEAEVEEKPGKKPVEPPKPQPAVETPRVSVGEKQLGGELKVAQETLWNSTRRESRRSAARTLKKQSSVVPRYVSLAAELELASACGDKKSALEEMRTLGDPRVLPLLERMAATPRRGCGLLRLNDCLACVRRELDQTIGALDGIGR